MQAFCLQNAYVIIFPVIPQGYLPDTSWIFLTPCFQQLLYNSNQIPTRYHRKKIKIIQSKQSLCSYSPWMQALLELGLWSAAQHAGPYFSEAHGNRPLFRWSPGPQALYLMLGFEITTSVTVEYGSAVTTDTIVQNVIVEFSLQSIYVR